MPSASDIGRLGALVLHATHDSRELTANARAKSPGSVTYFEQQVIDADPSIVGNPAEIARRAEYARKAYFYRLALKSAEARRKGRPS